MSKLQQSPINIFIAYSREDKAYLDELLKHLEVLIDDKPIHVWHDAEIVPGERWETTIKTNLNRADIILLLISSDSLSSDYFHDQKMQNALQRHKQGASVVIPVILRPCMWESKKELSELQALPTDGKAVSQWSDADNAYTDIVKGIDRSIKRLKNPVQTSTAQSTSTRSDTSHLPTESGNTSKPSTATKSNKKATKPLVIGLLSVMGLALLFFAGRTILGDKTNSDEPTTKVITENPTQTTSDKEQTEKEEIADTKPLPETEEISAPEQVEGEANLPKMIMVKGGTFEMGCKDKQEKCRGDEKPAHTVNLSDFWMAEHEMTIAQFKAFVDATNYTTTAEEEGESFIYFEYKVGRIQPSVSWRDNIAGEPYTSEEYDNPVIHVSWSDAVAYCEWLSHKTGHKYRLPTEAEWEYAARGGIHKERKLYSGGDDIDIVAWHGKNAKKIGTRTVKTKKPNALGLYDMSGNVQEWCRDWYSKDYYEIDLPNNPKGLRVGTKRVIRGGSWYEHPSRSRVKYRAYQHPSNSKMYIGFRVVRAV